MSERLSIKDLRVARAGRHVLAVERLSVEPGSLTVIAGDAGSGKSTFAAALAGGLEAEGQVSVDGVRLTGPPSRRRRAGLAAAVRDGERLAGCTVREALTLAAREQGRVGEALRRFPSLARREDVAAQLVSGGEQQILQVACAWAGCPAVLVLDSPTVGLAADAAQAVLQLARDEASAGCAVIWLESDRRAAPAAPAYTLLSGRVAAAAASGPGGA